jgi:hypothetical protein
MLSTLFFEGFYLRNRKTMILICMVAFLTVTSFGCAHTTLKTAAYDA